ncbi:hypothetical protein [Streptomyces sp. SAJ15]|uniref:hypothetical protein n=1 Tax=Streptomyces sp. SAJ15 TaxID=2011095 RepID=UPI001186CE26|nr:hypothetical protein [Streptomyces sp. SAJ15]TVL89463.1 hypothetical protein CD790_26600 [Streptomyces sp. SAJ15]
MSGLIRLIPDEPPTEAGSGARGGETAGVPVASSGLRYAADAGVRKPGGGVRSGTGAGAGARAVGSGPWAEVDAGVRAVDDRPCSDVGATVPLRTPGWAARPGHATSDSVPRRPGPAVARGGPSGTVPPAVPRPSAAPRRAPRWATDPVHELADDLAEVIAAAVHPDEIAAVLEADGLTGDQVRERFGRRDTFELAAELYARTPRGFPEPPAGTDPWRVAPGQFVLRGLVFTLPGLGYALGAPFLGGPPDGFGLPAGCAALTAAALLGWAWNQALAHRAFTALAVGGRAAAGRSLLSGAPIGALLGFLAAWLLPASGGVWAFAAGQSGYLAAATALLVLGRERLLLLALAPTAAGALALPLFTPPGPVRVALLAATVAGALAMAGREVARTGAVWIPRRARREDGEPAASGRGEAASGRGEAASGTGGAAAAPDASPRSPISAVACAGSGADAPRARLVPWSRHRPLRGPARAVGGRWARLPVVLARSVPGARTAPPAADASRATEPGAGSARRFPARRARRLTHPRRRRGRPRAGGGLPPVAASLPYGLFGLGCGVLTTVAALGDVLRHTAGAAVAGAVVVALTLSMGVAEWLLYRCRSRALAALAASRTPGGLLVRAGRVLGLCLAGYLTALALLCHAVDALWPVAAAPPLGPDRLLATLALGAVLWTGLLLQAFGSAWFPAAVCLLASGVEATALAADTGSSTTVQLLACGGAAVALLAAATTLLGRTTTHR